jgi:Na+/proline symporter
MEAHAQTQSGEQVIYVEKAGNGLAVAGFVCALIGAFAGLVPILFWLAIPLGVLGLVFGIVGRRRAKREPAVGRRGMASWGVALGIVAVGLGIWGATVVASVSNDLQKASDNLNRDLNNANSSLNSDLNCVSKADTIAEINACEK